MKSKLQLLLLILSLAIFPIFIAACGTSDSDDEEQEEQIEEDDDDDVPIVCVPEGDMSKALYEAELGALDSDNPELDADAIADGLLYSEEVSEVCAGEISKLAIGVLSLFEEIDGVLSLLGGLGLKTAGEFVPQQGMNVGDILDGFVDPIFGALSNIDDAAEVIEDSGCEWAPECGVLIKLGESPTGMIYFRARVNGTWGQVEARLLGSFVDIITALLDFVLSHDLDFDLTGAISKFSDLDTDQYPGNVPALVASAQWLFVDNPDFLKISDQVTFAEIPDLLVEAIDEIVPLHNNALIYGYSADHVVSIIDNGTAGILDGGDMINLQLELIETFGDLATGPIDPIEIPSCDTQGKPAADDDFCLGDDTFVEMISIANDVVKTSLQRSTAATCNWTDTDGCLALSDLNAFLLAFGMIDHELPPVAEFDLASFFIDPIGIREILLADDTLLSEAPLIIEGESAGDCTGLVGCGEYTFSGDSVHFEESITTDGVAPPVEGAVDLEGRTHHTYVLPYIQLGSCTLNGALWTNLAPLNDLSSIWIDDAGYYALGEDDIWDHGVNCDYNLNKLLAIAIKELGVLEETEE